MFSNFHTFTEVVKLSPNTFYELREINYSDKLLRSIFHHQDINTAEEISDLIENGSLVNKFVDSFTCVSTRETETRWINFVYKVAITKGEIIDKDTMLFRISSRYGLLDVVKHFRINRPEGCIEALLISAKNDRLEVVKYLLDNYKYTYWILKSAIIGIFPRNESYQYIIDFIKNKNL